jgi:hypothetical protein
MVVIYLFILPIYYPGFWKMDTKIKVIYFMCNHNPINYDIKVPENKQLGQSI